MLKTVKNHLIDSMYTVIEKKATLQKIILQWVSVLFITRYPHRFRVAVEVLG